LSAQKAGSAGSKKQPATRKKSTSTAKHAKTAPKAAAPERAPILDTRLKRELVGLLIAVLAVALFIAVVAPGNAIISLGVSNVTHLFVGLGAYVLPFLLLVWAASFFVEQEIGGSAVRLGIGLALIFLAALGIAGVLTPDAPTDANLIFKSDALMAHGGYLGGALAWMLLKLVGEAITFVILIGIIIAGIILIGFSITAVVTRVKERLARRRSDEAQEGTLGAYDLTGDTDTDASEGRKSRKAKGKLLPATAQMGGAAEPTRMLAGDFSQGDQGRIPLEALDDERDLGNLGSTRRLAASMNDLDDDGNDTTHGTTTVLLDKKKQKGQASSLSGETSLADSDFELPGTKLLKVSPSRASSKAGESELRQTATELQSTIDEFGVDAQVEGWVAGPTVTLFKISLGEGVRLTKINSLADDIALALAAPAVRIFSPIPGTTLVGIEVPNISRSTVLLGDVLPSAPDGSLQLAIGKDVEGDSIVANLEKMPHLLIGGTTGSGKSVAINTMIMSILMRATPAQVRMILIDPKMVELSLYNDIPHLYVPVVTDAQKAAAALAWGVLEMERRLKIFQQAGSKNIAQYNEYVRKELAKQAAEAAKAAAKAATRAASVTLSEAKSLEENESTDTDVAVQAPRTTPKVTYGEDELAEMPLIVIVIDELADLMMAAGKEVEISISRIAQLARAAGLHLIIATQRPSTNVITGLIKANIVNRIAFNVASGIDSRVILDTPGAEKLIGLGDLLFSRPEYGKPQRIQGCYVSESEIEAVVEFLKGQGAPEYHEDILATAVGGISTYSAGGGDGGDDDPLVWEAAEIVVSSQMGSTSTLQRRLKVGYARAGRIMDMLEQKGIVGPPSGSKPREVLVDDVLDLESLRAIECADDNW
jgi:S-DNA-T family DNA segregation ATPase FtsK/SpoIIIE